MEKASMEKTTEAGERTGIAEETVVVRSVVEDVLIADIPDTPVKGIKDEGDVLVMVGAEIIDTPNELSKKPKEGSGLVSIPTILEEELQQLLAQNSTAEEKVAVKKDQNMDDKSVLALKVGGVEDNELKTETNAGPEGEKKEKKEKREKGEDKKNTEKDEKKKEKKEKKDKKEKDEKKKEKKEKKSKKSDVERIRKKLEKIHAKIDRIHAKKQEYLQRLEEAEEKERQERERHAAEAGAKQEQDLAPTAKSSVERNGDALSGEAREDEEAVEAAVKQVEPSENSSAKHLEKKISAPVSSSNTGTTEKEVSKQPTGVTDDLVLDPSSARG